MPVVDSTFVSSPADADSPAQGALQIRDTRQAWLARLQHEHASYVQQGDSTDANDGWHLPGSAVAYVYAGNPQGQVVDRPDGSGTLGTSDTGRLCIDTLSYQIYIWNGTLWQQTTPGPAGVPQANVVATINSFAPVLVPAGYYWVRINAVSGLTAGQLTDLVNNNVILRIDATASPAVNDASTFVWSDGTNWQIESTQSQMNYILMRIL